MKSITVILAAIALTGCAGLQQAINAGEASAHVAAKAASDNYVRVWAASACATPLSAVIRNPDVIPALKALCIHGGDAASPSLLLDAAAK